MRKKYLYLFLSGSTLYPLSEIIYRGYSHYSMALCGGICVCLINKVCAEKLARHSIFLKSLVGGAIITAAEFSFGVLFNLILKEKVWDYSSQPFNILGQICLPFFFIWCIVSLGVIAFCNIFKAPENAGVKAL